MQKPIPQNMSFHESSMQRMCRILVGFERGIREKNKFSESGVTTADPYIHAVE